MVAKGKQTVAKRKPSAAKSKPSAAKSKPSVAKSKPNVAKSKPNVAKSKPNVAKSKPGAAKSTPSAARSKPSAARSKPRASRSKPRERTDSIQHLFEPYRLKRGEKYMSEAQKTHFRAILLAWKTQLMTEVDRTVNHMQDEAAKFPDPTDRASQEEEFNLELKTRDRERKLIRKIDGTIDLIDQNDYGYCVTCGVEIGIRRLEARPTATQCIDCKTLDEIKERQILGG
jgi:DnaK suppressor protein